MGKSKYSLEFKTACVVKVLQGCNSISSVAKELEISKSLVKQWIKYYVQHGSGGLLRTNNRVYDARFKLKVLQSISESHLSVKQACLKFNIGAESSILNWQHAYEKSGILGLENKPKGRPKIMNNNKGKKKKSDKSLTREQELLLENERLRAEIDYLKKLDALALASKKQKPSRS
ncbi:helix-turn-helix domain-containing protein [Chryseobacterium herbae]|uniref:Helix-turn-helix domain-containing protein n=1 Tax=Chryseobacterium herbae TaxID=2976476 RepID=A0ABT2IY28_9FLAO|nr:helix-turn-helix domain-containing protein [Chryseobacterium sp. pc1-10]MCT2563702.1 helix-turn-helix domain-containing protein [Chryseobacterium sp. pc1-10]